MGIKDSDLEFKRELQNLIDKWWPKIGPANDEEMCEHTADNMNVDFSGPWALIISTDSIDQDMPSLAFQVSKEGQHPLTTKGLIEDASDARK